jgi:hypothetical protein
VNQPKFRTDGFSAGAGLLIAVLALLPRDGEAAPIPVSFAEGTTHGYLVVQDATGKNLAQGELLQTVRGSLVESRLIFRFKDGSLHDERTTFSQRRVFTLHTYRLIQRGPSFAGEIDITLKRKSGRYHVRSRAGPGRPEAVTSGKVDLPPDVYNGVIATLLKNLKPGKSETVRLVTFMPEPKLIDLELHPEAEESVHVGEVVKTATRWVLKPQVNGAARFFGKALGRLPDEFRYRVWILHDEVPAFARFEGPLHLMGPVRRVQLLSPRAPESPSPLVAR